MAKKSDSDKDMPHTVVFELEYKQGLSIGCSADAFSNKQKALEAKSKLDQMECVFGARVKRC